MRKLIREWHMTEGIGRLLLAACCLLPAAPLAAQKALQKRLDARLDAPPFNRQIWGVALVDEKGSLLFGRNADRMFMPASNTKIVVSAVATRTYSRATPGPTEQDHDSQCAIDRIPHCAHPLRRLNSATSRNHSRVCAANPAAIDVIRPSSSISGSSSGSTSG